MVSDLISKTIHTSREFLNFWPSFDLRQIWKSRVDVCLPDVSIIVGAKEIGPKIKCQCRHDLISGGLKDAVRLQSLNSFVDCGCGMRCR